MHSGARPNERRHGSVNAVTEGISVERDLEIAASPETVWELLTDPGAAIRWMGWDATFDLRPGGAYRVEVIPGNSASREFVEIDRPRRLVYTCGWEEGSASSLPPGSTTIEFDLVPKGGGTLLRFRHSGLPNREAAESHGRGWDHYFARLAVVAAGGDAGADPWIDGPMQ
jgi:uncharacterized protein YndB with AHSA1/START domain